MENQVNDYTLWKNLLNGDRLALDKIYKDNLNSLYEYGMRMLQDEDAVRDCLHNVFVKIWVNHTTLSQTDNIRFYLISALRNNIINYRTVEGRFQKVDIEETEIFDIKFTVEEDYIRQEEFSGKAKQLSEAMNKLTPRQKEILYLKYFEEMDYEEIAEIMALSVKGAYKLSARALEALRLVMNVDKALLLAILLGAKRGF